LKRLLPLILLLAGCSGSRSGTAAGSGSPSSATPEGPRDIPTVALRLPSGGGPVRAYALPSLTFTGWAIGGRASPARAVVGMDVAGRRLLYRDNTGAIDAFDLVANREKAVAPVGTIATVASDGTLLAVSADGSVIESEPWGSHRWPNSIGRGVRDAFAAAGSRLIAIRHAGGDSLSLASRETGVSLSAPVPDATGRGASRDGDAVAFATDSGLVVAEDRDPQNPWFVRLGGSPLSLAFSPSGHRIYVALRTRSELAVVDRYQRRTRPAIPLPGPAGALRVDPWGRAILVRPGGAAPGDSTWVVATSSERVAGRLITRWASDLPIVSEGGVLLAREGGALVARDIRSLDSLGAIAGGAADLWLVGRWKPTNASAAVRQEARAADSARGAPAPVRSAPPAAHADTVASPARAPNRGERAAAPAASPGPARMWVQVSVSQNERWARDLAAALVRDGRAAQVIAPRAAGEGWRVVVGPFTTRTAADSAARLLGRPYWIFERGEGPGRP
jgi:hypothetical protein